MQLQVIAAEPSGRRLAVYADLLALLHSQVRFTSALRKMVWTQRATSTIVVNLIVFLIHMYDDSPAEHGEAAERRDGGDAVAAADVELCEGREAAQRRKVPHPPERAEAEREGE
jgi:hypothetical protein